MYVNDAIGFKMTPEQIAALKEQILKKEEASETAPDEA